MLSEDPGELSRDLPPTTLRWRDWGDANERTYSNIIFRDNDVVVGGTQSAYPFPNTLDDLRTVKVTSKPSHMTSFSAFLAATPGFNPVGAVANVYWGRGLTEQVLVRAIGSDPDDADGNGDVGDKNVIHYHMSPCLVHGGGWRPPYTSSVTAPTLYKHGACDQKKYSFAFTANRNGCCPPSQNYLDYWEEQGVARWFMTGRIELLDQEKEWHFEHTAGTNSGHLFIKLPDNNDPMFVYSSGTNRGKRKYGFFARTTIYSFVIANAPAGGVTVSGLSFFASFFRIEHSNGVVMEDNHFYYPTTSKSMLKRPNGDRVTDFPDSMTFINCNDAVVQRNKIAMAEGKAIEWRGDNVLWRDNVFEYNGWNLFDGDYTVRLLGRHGQAERVPSDTSRVHDFGHNLFRYNNQGGAIYVGVPYQNIHHNWIRRQNVGQFSQFFEVLGGDEGAEHGKFNHNWIEWSGYGGPMIRLDQASISRSAAGLDTNSNLAKLRRFAEVMHNVVYESNQKSAPFFDGVGLTKPTLEIKGDAHTVFRNSIFDGEMRVHRNYKDTLCGMNDNSNITKNIIGNSIVKGEPCTSNWAADIAAGGRQVSGYPTGAAENLAVGFASSSTSDPK